MEKPLAKPVVFAVFLILADCAVAQFCRLSVAGVNQARRVMGPVSAECPGPLHSAPFGNWGVTSNFGTKENGHQFQGWCRFTEVCDNLGVCRTECRDAWHQWNSCTTYFLYEPPNCTLYNAADCTEQVSTTGINVHGAMAVTRPVPCPADTTGDGIADQGGCSAVTSYNPGQNFMSLYELDPITPDELVQTLYFPDTEIALECGVLGCAPAASDWMAPFAYDNPSAPPVVYAEMAVVVGWGVFIDDFGFCGTPVSTVTGAHAASFQGTALAPDSIATVFGLGLTTDTRVTPTPVPGWLMGVDVRLADSSGAGREAPVFFVSPGQINFLVPAGTTSGPATITVGRPRSLRWTGQVEISPVAPGLFSANSDGQGVAAAVVLRVAADGSRASRLAFDCGEEAGSCAPAPINLGADGGEVYLELYGTGIRGRQSQAHVRVTIGGEPAEVLYAGPQGSFAGLAQVNVRLPAALRGRGEVEIRLEIGGRPANVVTVHVL